MFMEICIDVEFDEFLLIVGIVFLINFIEKVFFDLF